MSIVWILLIIAVAIAPLVSALPSEAQRYEAKVREHAMDRGVIVKLGSTPDIPARFRMPSDLSLVAYRRRRVDRHMSFDHPQVAVRSSGVWCSVPLEKSLTGSVLSLPDGAHIVELSEDYVSVFWDERGNVEAVDKVITVIDSLMSDHGFE